MKTYKYKVEGVEYTVNINEVEGNIAKVTVNDKPIEVELEEQLRPTPKRIVVSAPVAAPAAAPKPSAAPAAPKPAAAAGAGKKVVAPLPGTITSVEVTVGQAVKAGDTVVVLEAMKMQNNIEAECDGNVTSVLVGKGDAVMEGATLVTIG
ncbi:MAG: biotin/lipoyl-containing protein [Prevotellaceae bacterium]|nr:biotin/lipoyl-containing protein [Prevotellaceae bacterium]